MINTVKAPWKRWMHRNWASWRATRAPASQSQIPDVRPGAPGSRLTTWGNWPTKRLNDW